MTDVVVFVGKTLPGGLREGFLPLVVGPLERLGLTVQVVQQAGVLAGAAREASSAMGAAQASMLITVGYSVSSAVAEVWERRELLLAALPDIPSDASTVFISAVEKLEVIARNTDLIFVADEASRSLVEYTVPGAAGGVAVTGDVRQVLRLWDEQKNVSAPVRVLISSHDFRFIADVCRMLQGTIGVEVRFQQWDLAASAPDSLESTRADMVWADVVLCEWAGRNAVWYSRNIPSGKRLVVRLHGFESRSEWISGLDFGRVNELITVSDFYREHLSRIHGWQAGKIAVIGNSIECASFDRPKLADSKYRLGMLGFTPLLKRPDFALEVLRRLVAEDTRFTLHLRGTAPWEYPWIWNRDIAEVEAYRALYQQVGADPVLRHHVVFEPAGSNVEAWFTKIGWVLSLSERETFHVAAAEGMASGAVPVFLERRGVADIFSDHWVFDSAESIARYIAMAVRQDLWEYESQVAQDYAARFDFSQVADDWLRAITGKEN